MYLTTTFKGILKFGGHSKILKSAPNLKDVTRQSAIFILHALKHLKYLTLLHICVFNDKL